MEYFKAIGVNTLVANIVAKLSADIEIRLNEKEVTQVTYIIQYNFSNYHTVRTNTVFSVTNVVLATIVISITSVFLSPIMIFVRRKTLFLRRFSPILWFNPLLCFLLL